MPPGTPANDAGACALDAEARWIDRNRGVLGAIKAAGWHVMHWRDWFDRPEFATRLAALADYDRAQHEANAARRAQGLPPAMTLEDVTERDARSFASRKVNPETEPDRFARLVAHSRDYVREELSVFAMQTDELPAAEIYPGSNLASAEYLVGRKDLPLPLRPLARRCRQTSCG